MPIKDQRVSLSRYTCKLRWIWLTARTRVLSFGYRSQIDPSHKSKAGTCVKYVLKRGAWAHRCRNVFAVVTWALPSDQLDLDYEFSLKDSVASRKVTGGGGPVYKAACVWL